jgi:hypothetical protein
MQLLGLSEDSGGNLPASRFPERASTYFCDKCGEDITEHFSVRCGHGSPPLGPPTFYCECGERYLSGTREWDHLGPNEKRATLGGLGNHRAFCASVCRLTNRSRLGNLPAQQGANDCRHNPYSADGPALTFLEAIVP